MKQIAFCVVTVIVVTSWTPCLADDTVCNGLKRTKKPTDPDLPDIFDETKSYQAHIEVNLLDQGSTKTFDEYLDNDRNRLLHVTYEDGQGERALFLFDTEELFVIKNDDCEVRNMSQYTSNLDDLGPTVTKDGQQQISGLSRYFNFLSDSVYQGVSQVRGVQAGRWATCVDKPGTQDKVYVQFFFTQPGWHTGCPSSTGPIPLRVELQSVSNSSAPTGQSPNFHHVYEVVNFQPEIKDQSVFKIPEGQICRNRKNTKPLPKFGKFFSCHIEHVDFQGEITHSRVWYDSVYQMMRVDKRVGLAHPVTEIQDYNTGIRYTRDNILGNCTLQPLTYTISESHLFTSALDRNGTLVLDMKEPTSFFLFNDNYAYYGTRIIRGIQCDVFRAVIPDYPLGGSDVTAEAIFEYAFLQGGFTDVPLSGFKPQQMTYPLQLLISVPGNGYKEAYSFVDYDEESARSSVFDISDCFNYQQRVDFKVTFTDPIQADYVSQWENTFGLAVASAMKVSPFRIAQIRVLNDSEFVTAYTSLLSSANFAQFILTAFTAQRDGDAFYNGIHTSDDCATKCVQHNMNATDFLCHSFDFCPHDNTCRLSKTIESSGAVTGGQLCDRYTRTVVHPSIEEPSLQDAYLALETKVQTGNLKFSIQPLLGQVKEYTAITIERTGGAALQTKSLPKLPSQMSYKLETVIPGQSKVEVTYVWFDKIQQLARFDHRDEATVDQLDHTTWIQNFKTGVAYQIDQETNQCHVSSLSDHIENISIDLDISRTPDGNVRMDNPLGFLHLDQNFVYVGQKSVRGILCDVFDSDLSLTALNWNTRLYRVYFQTDNQDYVTVTGTGVTRQQPVMVEVIAYTNVTYMVYNIYDFTETPPNNSLYDISPCFTVQERKNVLLEFTGYQYETSVKGEASTFTQSVVSRVSDVTGLSVSHIQRVRLTYDKDNIYVLMTLLGRANISIGSSPSLQAAYDQFLAAVLVETQMTFQLKLQNVTLNATNLRDVLDSPQSLDSDPASVLDPFTMIQSVNLAGGFVRLTKSQVSVIDCAMLCLRENVFECQAFSFVTTNKQCALTDTHADENTDVLTSETFSTVFSKRYTVQYQRYTTRALLGQPDKTIARVATDEMCARACDLETDFRCESFETCEVLGGRSCVLKRRHVFEVTDYRPTISAECYLYSREHLYDYIKREKQQIVGHDDFRLDLDDPSACAQACSSRSPLSDCSSFEMCRLNKAGPSVCVLSQADPTQHQEYTVSNSDSCTLYTLASSHSAMEPTKQPVFNVSSSSSAQHSSPGQWTGPTTTQRACAGHQEADDSSVTGPRAGIAVGMLILGLLVGGGVALLVQRKLRAVSRSQSDDTASVRPISWR